jgi:DNA ligase-4
MSMSRSDTDLRSQKDYIPNLGDCIDLVMLGAGWDMDRARGLRGESIIS